MSTVVCTLFEGRHGIGAGALVNSLYRSGYRGVVVCAHRGPLPGWSVDAGTLEGLTVRFRPVERPEHLTYVKPWLLLEELGDSDDVDRVVYLDPDVVVKCEWAFLEMWMNGGVAAVEDVNGRLPASHPLRGQWRRYLEGLRIPRKTERNVYVNAGFLGVPRAHAELLSVWWQIVQSSSEYLGELSALKNRGPNDLFHSADQDALNMALEVVDVPLTWVGKEGMDFAPGGHLLSHGIGSPKPWEPAALRGALRGDAPAMARSEFLRYATSPLAALPTSDVRRLRRDLQAAKAVSRVMRRSS